MDGRDPGTGERLKRVGGRSKVAAFDLTFSAPKSVSVLFAIGEPGLAGALVEAHESAVDAALGYLEREACRVRRGRGGVRREVGEGFVAAAYRHRMSRAEDPQLHTHVVAANMARGADGRWTALDATPIYEHAKAAGFVYQAHLRAAVVSGCRGWVGAGPQRDGRDRADRAGGAAGVLHPPPPDRGARGELVAAGVRSAMAGVRRSRTTRAGASATESTPRLARRRARAGGRARPRRPRARRARARTGQAPEIPDRERVSGELAGAGGLTEKQNTFAKREAVMAWAAAHGQGAPADGSSARRGVPGARRRAPCARTPERRFTTSDLLAHEQTIVPGAQARRGKAPACWIGARRRGAGERAVRADREQAGVIRGLTVERARGRDGRGAGRDGQDVHRRPARPGLHGRRLSGCWGPRRPAARCASSTSRPASARRGR